MSVVDVRERTRHGGLVLVVRALTWMTAQHFGCHPLSIPAAVDMQYIDNKSSKTASTIFELVDDND